MANKVAVQYGSRGPWLCEEQDPCVYLRRFDDLPLEIPLRPQHPQQPLRYQRIQSNSDSTVYIQVDCRSSETTIALHHKPLQKRGYVNLNVQALEVHNY